MEDGSGRVGLRVLAIAALAAGAGLYFYGSRLPAPRTRPSAPPVSETPYAAPAPQAAPGPAVTLEASDDWLRARAATFSPSPPLRAWLKSDRLVRRLAAAAVLIADGNSPRDSLDFLGPDRDFTVRRARGKLFMDPRSCARYDAVGDAFQSLNAAAAAEALKTLMPLLDAVCRELECVRGGFRETLSRAIRELLRTPVLEGEIRLREKVNTYALADPKLEGLTAAQKHLLRMGPRNTVKIQGKLRELAGALGIPEDRLRYDSDAE